LAAVEELPYSLTEAGGGDPKVGRGDRAVGRQLPLGAHLGRRVVERAQDR
jgi:hypothetical protein